MIGQGRIDRGQRPAPGPAPNVVLPRFERLQMRNGLSVLLIRKDELPEVSTRIVLPYGSAEDQRDRAGAALLTARALTEGTRQRSALEVAERLDYLGASFGLEVEHDATVLSLHFLSRVFDSALDFLAEVVAEPAFLPNEVERLRDERLDEIARGLDEPRTIASLRLAEATFGDHAYGLRTGGVAETVSAIEPETLKQFHESFYRPSAATLILVGDLPQTDALSVRLEAAFDAWRGSPGVALELPDPDSIAGRRIWAVNWPGPQSEVRVGRVGVARSDPDYPAVSVMNAILGGLFSSRINMNLREDKGWTYGAGSRFDARKRRGPFYVATAVDAEATVGAVREIVGELERMKTRPASDEELELAVNALTLSLPRLFETPSQIAGRVAQQVIHSLPDDYWLRFAEDVRAVTRADVGRVAERLLPGDDAAIVVVGPVEGFQADLAELGPVEMRDIHGRPAPELIGPGAES
jgi:predicted Zn-dependent peptidase